MIHADGRLESDPGAEFYSREGLPDKIDALIEATLVKDCVLGITEL